MRKAIAIAAVTALVGMGGMTASLAAHADTMPPPVGTETTLGVQGGALTLTAADSALFDSISAGQSSAGGQLGVITVTDMRAELDGTWTASAVASDFANTDVPAAAVIPATDLTYSPGAPTAHSGNATFGYGADAQMDNSASVIAYTTDDEIGVASVSWNPTVSIAVPSDVVAGTYVGTITHSLA